MRFTVGPEDPVTAVATLGEPVRRRLYEFVARSGEPVSRDAAAQALGVPRSTAAFHLDRLAAEGLLAVSHKRLTARTGPGAGRPAKLYRRAETEIAVSLPERRYDLAADLLAEAVQRSADTGAAAGELLRDVAREAGRRIGRSAQSVEAALAEHGFEPAAAGDRQADVVLNNCPFHRLAERFPDLVCGANLALMEGLADVMGGGHRAVLAPAPGRCCVRLESREPTDAPS